MRSTLMFTMLLIVVFLGYQYFFKPTPPATPTASQTQRSRPRPLDK